MSIDDEQKERKCTIRHASSPLSSADRDRIFEVALERMCLIGGKLYGIEDEAEPEAFADCLSRLELCKALCCTYVFPLTKEEASKGQIQYNPDRPYYIARDSDGYCPYLDRATYKCSIHDHRPLRCRKYACSL